MNIKISEVLAPNMLEESDEPISD